MLAVSSIATYGILLAGWSANSKYAFLGSLRSTAQLISYELVLSSAILLVIMLTGNLNLTENIEAQNAVWFIFPLFPIFIIFFIGSIAETNRAPFDLAEAESELVSGFMTEHAAVVFVFFFLAEYGSIVLMCILTAILFLGGYLFTGILEVLNNIINILIDIYNYIVGGLYHIYTLYSFDYNSIFVNDNKYFITTLFLNILLSFKEILAALLPAHIEYLDININLNNSIFEGLEYGLSLGLKSSILIFIFIWTRASFPRIRFDQLMAFCWTVLLPILFGFIVLIPCILYSFNIYPINIPLV